jgi:acetyl esterase/lipase
MPSLQSRILIFGIRRMKFFAKDDIDPVAMRVRAEKFTSPVKPPRGVERISVKEQGIDGEWLIPHGAEEDSAVLYIHGGAWFLGSTNTHRRLAGALAKVSGVRVLSINYRLAPEHPFPAALEDCQAAYEWLLAQGIAPGKIIVAGDSAGGNLALALLVSLRDQGKALPAGAVGISPVTDLTGSGASYQTRRKLDPYFNQMGNNSLSRDYLGTADAHHPYLSPLFADLSGLPPLLIQVGDHEILLDDSILFGEKARAAGVQVEVEVWQGMFHVFQLYADILPEARQALVHVAQFVRARLETNPTEETSG